MGADPRAPEIQRHLDAVLRHGHDERGFAFDRVAYNHDPGELRDEHAAPHLSIHLLAHGRLLARPS